MPIYEFICNDCNKKADILLRSINSDVSPACPYCNSQDTEKVISNFAYHQSEQMRRDVSDALQKNTATSGINDPRDIGRWTEDKLSNMGIDIRNGKHKDTFASVRNMIDKARDGDTSILDKKDD
jgi:putative FmdB family regulatory protein